MKLTKLRKIDYRHFITTSLILLIILYLIKSPTIFNRLIISLIDIRNSFFYYLNKFFGYEIFSTKISITQNVPDNNIVLPKEYNLFSIKFKAFFTSLLNNENCNIILSSILNNVVYFIRWLLLIILLIPMLLKMYNRYFHEKPKKTAKTISKPLQFYLFAKKQINKPIAWLKKYYQFIKSHKYYAIPLILLLLYRYNIYSIIISFFAYYFYFIISFDFVSIYGQIVKLFADIVPLLQWYFIPLWLWFITKILSNITRSIGYARLNHMEYKNRGYINSLDNTIFITGKTRKGKTTLLSDITISYSIMFRDKALEKLTNISLKWVNFPFFNLEKAIQKAIKKEKIYNLATCKAFIEEYQNKFAKLKSKRNIFNYEYKKYPLYIYNELVNQYIFEALKDYSCLYFIYIFNTSYIIGNLAIRTDEIKNDLGYFPLYDTDLFFRNENDMTYSHRSHILDMDSVRLVKTLIIDNPNASAVDFGIFNLSEVAKERGNMPQNQDIKKNDNIANPKNDGFDLFLKMHGHSSTIDGYCFSVFIMDDQSAESLGAEARRLCSVLEIEKTDKDLKMAMPFFIYRPLLCDLFIMLYAKLYFKKFRHTRQDQTLLMHLLKNTASFAFHYLNKIENIFGYRKFYIQRQTGRLEGVFEEKKYYIMPKKIYSDRFDTACFNDFFNARQLSSGIGLMDIPEYEATKATLEELKLTNSYFINDLLDPDWREKLRKAMKGGE